MAQAWQLQDAKNRLSEVVDAALKSGPQVITRRGEETAVVLSYTEYRRLLLCQKPLSAFFRESPAVGLDVDLTRDAGPLREDAPL